MERFGWWIGKTTAREMCGKRCVVERCVGRDVWWRDVWEEMCGKRCVGRLPHEWSVSKKIESER
jgi:hypothetical protein